MIGVDAALVLIAGGMMLGTCFGTWLGYRLHAAQLEIDEVIRGQAIPRRRGLN